MSVGFCLTPIFQKLAPTYTGITVNGCTHMPIHGIWRCLNTLYTSNMDVGCSKWWFTASTMTPQHIWAMPYPNFPKFGPHLHMYNCVRVHPYHPIWMWDAIRNGLQSQPWCHNIIWASPYPNFPKFAPHLHRYNSERMHLYAHSQHRKVLEHFIHIQYGCGMQ